MKDDEAGGPCTHGASKRLPGIVLMRPLSRRDVDFRILRLTLKEKQKNRLWRCELASNKVKWRVLLVTELQKTRVS
jgi:predicted neuraminidase